MTRSTFTPAGRASSAHTTTAVPPLWPMSVTGRPGLVAMYDVIDPGQVLGRLAVPLLVHEVADPQARRSLGPVVDDDGRLDAGLVEARL